MRSPTFRLDLLLSPQQYDAAIALVALPGLLGCEEKQEPPHVRLTAHFKTEQSAREARDRVAAVIPEPDLTITRTEPQDWNAKWRESMKPACIARGYYVSPLWLPPPATARHWIKIEPKMAFGTGHHETTRLAARAIISMRPWLRGKRVLDIGTGSGVLCFVADRCGAAYSLGIEIDPDCCENIAENLRNNPPAGRIAFCIGLTDSLKVTDAFDLAVMNMILTESAPLLSRVARLLDPAGLLIWSGILQSERRETIALAEPHGLRLTAEKTEHEWWCGRFVRA
ncbi:MAG: 50S ribosomal protein L11 methyltransferase [Chitinispirillaceae bacterium]|nr:50S ribosomal protein L11 methyltransferase [Chitinispirillaceae bacterium]